MRIDFDPIAGDEQGNVRPAVVLSNQGFNDRSDLIVCIPCTTKIKGFPFEVAVSGLPDPSVALAHQVRTMDWRARAAKSVGFVADGEMLEIRAKLRALLHL